MTGLDGRAIIITGAGSGLGREYALAAARAGGSIVVNDLDGALADDTARAITDLGGSAIAVQGSVTSWADTRRNVEICLDEFGHVDGVVANAAIMHMVEPWLEEESRLRAMADVNILGVQFTVRHAMAAMVEAGRGGSIVTIVSGAQFGNSGMSAYGASKGAVNAMTANWAVEGSAHGIRVNAVSPWALTKMTLDHIGQSKADPSTFPTPDAIAPLVVALLSDDTAGINGRMIRFDGHKLSSYELATNPIADRATWDAAEVGRVLTEQFPTKEGRLRSYSTPA